MAVLRELSWYQEILREDKRLEAQRVDKKKVDR